MLTRLRTKTTRFLSTTLSLANVSVSCTFKNGMKVTVEKPIHEPRKPEEDDEVKV